MIEDRHMAVGSWSIDLVPDCPQWIRDEFRSGSASYVDQFVSFVVFTESDFDGGTGRSMSESARSELAEQALYVGPVWERGNKMRHFAGPGLLGMLGNDRGAPSLEPGQNYPYPTWGGVNISNVIDHWFDTHGQYANGLTKGGAASPLLGTIDDMTDYGYVPPFKQPLDQLMSQTGNEYYVRPNGSINWGSAQALFEHPPRVLAAEGVAGGVAGYTVLEVPPDGIQVSEDVYGRTNGAIVLSADYDTVAGAGTAVTQYGTSNGPNVGVWGFGTRPAAATFYPDVLYANSNDPSDVNALAVAIAEAYADTTRTITISANDRCALASVRPGDWIALHSPDDLIVDMANLLIVDGQPIHPEWVRSVAVHQPFNPGMGAFVVRNSASTAWHITRITDYIADESGPCTIEVGSKPRPVVPAKYDSFIY